MGKTKRLKEFDELQKLKEENKKLKKQVSKLRKVINNIDIDHYNFVYDLLNSESFKEKPKKTAEKELEKKWYCFKCENGIMRLAIIHRAQEPYYFRKCDCCENKTKMKKYTEDVEGV